MKEDICWPHRSDGQTCLGRFLKSTPQNPMLHSSGSELTEFDLNAGWEQWLDPAFVQSFDKSVLDALIP